MFNRLKILIALLLHCIFIGRIEIRNESEAEVWKIINFNVCLVCFLFGVYMSVCVGLRLMCKLAFVGIDQLV